MSKRVTLPAVVSIFWFMWHVEKYKVVFDAFYVFNDHKCAEKLLCVSGLDFRACIYWKITG